MDTASLQSFMMMGDVASFLSEGLVAHCLFWRVFGCFVVLGLSWLDFAGFC